MSHVLAYARRWSISVRRWAIVVLYTYPTNWDETGEPFVWRFKGWRFPPKAPPR